MHAVQILWVLMCFKRRICFQILKKTTGNMTGVNACRYSIQFNSKILCVMCFKSPFDIFSVKVSNSALILFACLSKSYVEKYDTLITYGFNEIQLSCHEGVRSPTILLELLQIGRFFLVWLFIDWILGEGLTKDLKILLLLQVMPAVWFWEFRENLLILRPDLLILLVIIISSSLYLL